MVIQHKECLLHNSAHTVFLVLLGCRMCGGTKPTENSAHGSTVYQRKWGGGGTGPAERFPSMAPSQVNVRAWGGGSALDSFVDLRSLLYSH